MRDTYEIVILFVFSLVTMIDIWIVRKPQKQDEKFQENKRISLIIPKRVPQDRHPTRLDRVLRDWARI